MTWEFVNEEGRKETVQAPDAGTASACARAIMETRIRRCFAGMSDPRWVEQECSRPAVAMPKVEVCKQSNVYIGVVD